MTDSHTSRGVFEAGADFLVLAGLGGCRAGAEPQSHGDHADEKAVTGGSIPSCTPGREPDLALKERKVRVARGVYRASRKLAVEGDLELWDTPYGQSWVVAEKLQHDVRGARRAGREIYGDTVTGVRKGDVVLDGGAHFGGFTRTAPDRGAKLVVAIEIAPNIQVLRRNFAKEIEAGRVDGAEKGVWDKDATMVLERKNHNGASQVAPAGPGPSVEVTTIRPNSIGLRLPSVDFIKLNIEGAERNATGRCVGDARTTWAPARGCLLSSCRRSGRPAANRHLGTSSCTRRASLAGGSGTDT